MASAALHLPERAPAAARASREAPIATKDSGGLPLVVPSAMPEAPPRWKSHHHTPGHRRSDWPIGGRCPVSPMVRVQTPAMRRKPPNASGSCFRQQRLASLASVHRARRKESKLGTGERRTVVSVRRLCNQSCINSSGGSTAPTAFPTSSSRAAALAVDLRHFAALSA